MLSQIMRYSDPLLRLKRSRFRRSFHLSGFEKAQVHKHGLEKYAKDAYEVINSRLSDPERYGFTDGRQTPWHGVVFKAQHATATCCRKCLLKWHEIPRYRGMTEEETAYALRLILRWIAKEARS